MPGSAPGSGGQAEALRPEGGAAVLIRIQPRLVIRLGLDSLDVDPHLLQPSRCQIT